MLQARCRGSHGRDGVVAARSHVLPYQRMKLSPFCPLSCSAMISYLKRGYGWDRTRLDAR